MKMKKLSVLLATCICSATLLTGCSFSVSEIADKVLGKTKEVTAVEADTPKAEKSGKVVDSSVEKPEFVKSIAGANQIAMGAVFELDATATSSQGTLSYQWYCNNVNANGGGTKLDGATDPVFTVDSTEPGRKFYYCVVTNDINGKINRNTSDTHEIVVWEIGTWQQDEETGGYRYILVNGAYPTKTWFVVEAETYYLDESGFRATGLSEIGDHTYYFNDEGMLQRDTTGPNGEQIDSKGRVVVAEAAAEGQSSEAPAEPSSEAPAEEQPSEAPAEEQPAEEAPAEGESGE